MINSKLTAEQISDLHGWFAMAPTQALLQYLAAEQERAVTVALNLRGEPDVLLLRSRLDDAANFKKTLAAIRSGDFMTNPT